MPDRSFLAWPFFSEQHRDLAGALELEVQQDEVGVAVALTTSNVGPAHALPTGEPVDVVAGLALPLPLLVIADLLGVPGDEWPAYARWSEAAIDAGTAQTEETDRILSEMATFLLEVIAAKRADPGDDLVSLLVTLEVTDPETGEVELLDDGELMMFCVQLLVAGNETTRNLVSGGLWALAEHPDQLARLVADPTLVPAAVDELLRWTTPVTSFVRTATVDTQVGGQAVAADEALLLLYASANRDEDAFGPTAGRLDVHVVDRWSLDGLDMDEAEIDMDWNLMLKGLA